MQLHEPTILSDGGPWAEHDVACPVLRTDEPAVLDLNAGVFQPSWKAQSQGWYLVHAKSRFQKLCLRLLRLLPLLLACVLTSVASAQESFSIDVKEAAFFDITGSLTPFGQGFVTDPEVTVTRTIGVIIGVAASESAVVTVLAETQDLVEVPVEQEGRQYGITTKGKIRLLIVVSDVVDGEPTQEIKRTTVEVKEGTGPNPPPDPPVPPSELRKVSRDGAAAIDSRLTAANLSRQLQGALDRTSTSNDMAAVKAEANAAYSLSMKAIPQPHNEDWFGLWLTPTDAARDKLDPQTADAYREAVKAMIAGLNDYLKDS